MTISKLIASSNSILKQAGIQNCVLDTQLLLAHFLGKDKLYLITHPSQDVPDSDGFFALVRRRAAFEPMAYILGTCEFMSLPFRVTPHTLIPRPDTEILVEHLIGHIGHQPAHLLDIGTGSGCIPISVLRCCPNATAAAVDISSEALTIAGENARLLGVEDRLTLRRMDILSDFPTQQFHVIASNPPYIERDVIPTLMRDVRDYEPHRALDGGSDGLDFYRRIVEQAAKCLLPGGLLAFEVGHRQSSPVMELMQNSGYHTVAAEKDLSGILRVVSGQLG